MDIGNLPTSRKEAKETGAKYYFTGKPCKHGHIAMRKTKGVCVECMKDDWKKQTDSRKGKPTSEAGKASQRRYYDKNKELVKARSKLQPIEKRRAYKKAYRARNQHTHNLYRNAWRERAKVAAPSWLSKSQRKDINDTYRLAMNLTKQTGEQYVVDHIVPLVSNIVCGLHVSWNLRVMLNEENARKGNRFDDEIQAIA